MRFGLAVKNTECRIPVYKNVMVCTEETVVSSEMLESCNFKLVRR
jgi:hypothetical protein